MIKLDDLKIDEIPQGVIDDLNEHHENVVFDLNETAGSELTTVKSNYVFESDEEDTGVVLDPETFKPYHARGYLNIGYLVRYIESDNGIIVKRVWQNHHFRETEILGEFVPKKTN